MTRQVETASGALFSFWALPGLGWAITHGSLAVADTIKQLLQERLAIVVKIHKAVVEGHSIAPAAVTLDDVHQAEVAVQSARLELCETKQDRIKAHETTVKEAEQWQVLVGKLGQGGEATPVDLLKAQAYLLEARIGFEKAKIAA